MSTATQYRCEICDTETANPNHWFMIECNTENEPEGAQVELRRSFSPRSTALLRRSARRYLHQPMARSLMFCFKTDFNRPSAS